MKGSDIYISSAIVERYESSYTPNNGLNSCFVFCLILWHINYCRLFNAKSFLKIYIKYDFWIHIVDLILNELELIFFFPQLNGFTYFYLIRIILLTINYLFVHSLMFSSIAMYHLQFN